MLSALCMPWWHSCRTPGEPVICPSLPGSAPVLERKAYWSSEASSTFSSRCRTSLRSVVHVHLTDVTTLSALVATNSREER